MNDLYELRWHPVMNPWLVAALVVVLVALLYVRPRFGQLTRGRFAALALLRLVVVLLTLFAMLRPELIYTKRTPQRASLVLLVDSSRSMQVADSLGDTTRWESVRTLLTAAEDDLAALAETWDVAAYQFDATTTTVDVRDGRVDLAASPDGAQTALGAAIGEVLDRQASGRVLGVLLLSDGAQRAVAPRDLPPQMAVRRMTAENIPLYTFTFGKSGGSERADLAIDDLVTNESVFAEAPTEVRGQLRSQGYANQRVAVQLLWESADGMQPVDTLQVDTGGEDRPLPIGLRYTPQTPGEYKVTLRVEPREGELVTTNNEASTFVTVRKGGINVLYLVGAKRIGGGPGPEQRFVRAALAQSPDIVVQRRLLDYQPADVDLRDEVRNGKIDVVILNVDVDQRRISLGHKQIQGNPWDAFEGAYKVGTEIEESKIVRIIEKGVIVELPLGVDGFVPLSQISQTPVKNINESFKLGDSLPLRVIEFDKESKKIVLSVLEFLRGKEQKLVDNYVNNHKLSPMTLKDMMAASVSGSESSFSEDLNPR